MGEAKRRKVHPPVRTTITPERDQAHRALQQAIGGKFEIGDSMAATMDLLAEIVGMSVDTIPEAEACIEKVASDLKNAIRDNWSELAWARRLLRNQAEGRA
ncbi:hypothetical protein LJR090_002520 [Bosea sp. LjRoot90]|uniref:hypothetical protein n=1 Tax=Bosea sp. LjRoot90 TaxID=3342342 RepID=UPI003ECC60AB